MHKKEEIIKALSQMDCCMMTTIDKAGKINTRPMLHNKVKANGDEVYFFSMKKTQKVDDIKENVNVSLSFQNRENTIFIQQRGIAEIVEDKETMAKHWDNNLYAWWKEGADTPDICMIRIQVHQIRYWQDGAETIIKLSNKS